jgi:hypothetical protein
VSDTDGFDPEDFEGVQPRTVNIERRHIRQLEKKAKAADDAQAELSNLRRDLAMTRAGIPESGPGALFRRAYDGPVDDVEAVKAAAIEYGVLGAQAPTAAETAGHQAVMQAATGAPAGPDVDVVARMKAARSPAEVARIAYEAGISPTDHPLFPKA